MSRCDLSIVIVNFNTKDLLKICFDSIIKHTKGIGYEIIVVDNASTDGSVEYLKSIKKNLFKVIFSKENLGFARGNNKGIKAANGRYILLLNSDTEISSNLLTDIVGWMDKNDKVGICGCALRSADGTIQRNGGFFPNLIRVAAWMLFLDDISFITNIIKSFHPLHLTKETSIDWLTGAFFFIRREVLQEIEGFDENYFMYVEDVDFCFRAKQKGFQIWYLPEWQIAHFGGASSGSAYPFVSEFKNVKLFYKKHYPLWQYPLLRAFLALGALLRIFVLGILKGPKQAKIYVNALGEV